MTSIDDLFKKPPPPGQKRKLDATRDPQELYKSIKLKDSQNARNGAQPSVEEDKDGDEDDRVAGPELPSEGDEEEEDPDGRFFGGGVAKDTAQALDYLDDLDKESEWKSEKFDTAWVRKLALNFERKISKNAELRAKFENDPAKFMSSEADLDADIKALSILTDHPELYPRFAELGCVSSLVSLLSHENTDIAIDAIQIVSELIDEDTPTEQSQWDVVVDAMMQADILDLLYQNVSRLDEKVESDRSGVYQIMSTLESICSKTSLTGVVSEHKEIIPWLLSRSLADEKPVSQNKQYAIEVLAILLQSSSVGRHKVLSLDGTDRLLQALSAYRKRDPEKGTEEEGFVSNLFDCLTCLVDEEVGKEKFLDSEGIELALIILKASKTGRAGALRLLDHALDGDYSARCGERLVEAAGLKPIFTLFMKNQDAECTEHLLGIFASLLRFLPGDSAPRIRLLGKFVEKDYEKIAQLVQLRRKYHSRLSAVDAEIAQEKKKKQRGGMPKADRERERSEEEWTMRRLDAGLFLLQTVDTILAWTVAEDDGAKARVENLLADIDESLQSIRSTLEEKIGGLDAESGKETTDMLNTLIAFLT